MRSLALASGGIFLLAALQQAELPAPLKHQIDVLSAAPSLTVEYTVRVGSDAAMPYKLVLSRPDAFRLTTPTGFVVSDGKTITTYDAKKKSYKQVPYTVDAFTSLPEGSVWGAFLGPKAMPEVVYSKVGMDRTIGGNAATEVEVVTRKMPLTTLYIDKKLGVARGWSTKKGDVETLALAKTIAIGKAPLPADAFAFVAPEGSSKEPDAPVVAYAPVKALISDRCLPCHGGGQPRAGIKLDTFEGVVAIVKPGSPDDSLLIKAVTGKGAKLMPIGNHPKLNADEVKLLSDWIAAGAKND